MRDVMPPGNPEGEGHFAGPECPCCPWSYWDATDGIVVVHRPFTEQVIHTSAPEAYERGDDAVLEILDEVEWEIRR